MLLYAAITVIDVPDFQTFPRVGCGYKYSLRFKMFDTVNFSAHV